MTCYIVFFFFFQAEDGIRDFHVTGVQTCALPISRAVGLGHRGPGSSEGAFERGRPRDRARVDRGRRPGALTAQAQEVPPPLGRRGRPDPLRLGASPRSIPPVLHSSSWTGASSDWRTSTA